MQHRQYEWLGFSHGGGYRVTEWIMPGLFQISQTRMNTMNRVEPPYDLRAGIVGSKASEAMIGFAGFVKNPPDDGDVLQGVLNISPFYRDDGSGYLTLTFVVDRQDGVTLDQSRRQLGVPDQADLEALLGSKSLFTIS